jgi:hypothetical protein
MMDAADIFAPLPEAPRSTTTAPRAKPAGDWLPELPAPEEPPAAPRHLKHGTPSATWTYRDAEGRALFMVARFDPPDGKELVPYTYGVLRGARGWHWKGPPTPSPLYRLHDLAARPAEPVLVVEGEKAAEAAALLFPEHVATTWQGGSSAAGRADWAPLAGRRVTIWPDHDDPGRKAAADVMKACRAAGAAAVAVVGIPDTFPPKWDVADALPADTTADTLRDMLARASVERADWLAVRLDMARKHRVPVGELDALRAEALRAQRQAEEPERDAPEPPADPRGRADLLVNTADLPDTAAELAAMLATVPHLFDRGGPARIARDRTRDGFVVEALNVNGVVNEAHRIARPWLWVKNRDGAMERRDVTLPERVAKLYLDHRDGWALRPLDGITSAPLLHHDGTVRAAEGYDPETRLWCERVPAVAVPDTPTKDDAAAALLRLRQHFRTFAFGDAERVAEAGAPVPVVNTTKPPGADESAFLCALLTAVCRPCLWLAPGLLVRAPEYSGAGTGKGLLVRSLCAVAFGARPVALTAGSTAEELDKRISTALMEAGATLFLDNVNSTALKSDVLASAITERPAAVRKLGGNTSIQLNPTAFVAVTGNGVLLSEDMARRFLTVELDAGMEDPEARDFRADFLADTMAARETLLRDVLTIWRWGRQMGDALPAGRALGSFTAWARWCRDPLVALRCTDPALRVADAKAKDPRRQNVAEIFTAWWEAHHDTPVAVSDLAQPVKDAADPAGRGRQYLAAKVRALDGTRAAGFVLTRSPSVGKWTPDLYALRQATTDAGAGAGAGAGAAAPMPPMPPMPSGVRTEAPTTGPGVWSDDL